ncbi:MAG: 2-oxoacid:acceptor oxidoreductase family protein [Clostridia bacterium]|nr:2-oxoacid:acceptor oxidoreductase family protein [Clostridia bacterium]MBQ4574338.1 2-oxoacid:acceptor oxidoreductase family protein [Clostridia bacterium]
MTTGILIAGFGGQGVQFSGKQIAKTGMYEGKQVSFLSSYGPEMRGGTSNCSVIISDEEIGSPLVTTPDVLIAFNIASYDKFESKIKAGGILFADSTLIAKKSEREDITAYYIPATGLANENGLTGFANVIMLGYVMAVTGLFSYETFLGHMVESIPESKAALIEKNKKALEIGFNYKA